MGEEEGRVNTVSRTVVGWSSNHSLILKNFLGPVDQDDSSR